MTVDIEWVNTTGNETIVIAYDDEGRELTAHIDWETESAYLEVAEDPF